MQKTMVGRNHQNKCLVYFGQRNTKITKNYAKKFNWGPLWLRSVDGNNQQLSMSIKFRKKVVWGKRFKDAIMLLHLIAFPLSCWSLLSDAVNILQT